MHQYQTVAQILFILSIFNLVFAVPVVREIYDTHGDEVVVPLTVRNVEALMSNERRQPTSDGPTPSGPSPPPTEGPMPSTSSSSSPEWFTPSQSPPPPPGSPGPAPSTPSSPSSSPDWFTPPQSPAPLPDESTTLHATPLVGEASLQEGPTAPGEPSSLAVSSLPDGTEASPDVPATDHSVSWPASSEIVPLPQAGTAALPSVPEGDRPMPTADDVMMALQTYLANQEVQMRILLERQRAERAIFRELLKKGAGGVAVVAIGGGLVAYYRLHHHHHRTIDPDCPADKGSRHLCLDD